MIIGEHAYWLETLQSLKPIQINGESFDLATS